jgi:hypothetical protein
MLTQLPDHFQTDFGDNWEHLVQQSDSRLKSKVNMKPINGKELTFSQLGKGKMRMITTRNGKTVPSDSPMAKGWVRLVGYDEVTYIDEFDDVSLGDLPAPESEHVQQHAFAANRTCDEVIIAALEGTRYIGEQGTTPVSVPVGQQVAVDYVKSGSTANSGLTLAKLLRTKFILDANEVEDAERYFVISAKQLYDLLNDVDQVSNADYASVKALVEGNVNRFAGFEFVRTELLTLDADTSVRTCIAYQKKGLTLCMGKEKKVKISIRDDLNETVQVRTVVQLGASRTEEERVVLVFCDELL